MTAVVAGMLTRTHQPDDESVKEETVVTQVGLFNGDPDLIDQVGAGNDLPINLVRSFGMARLLMAQGANANTVELSQFSGNAEKAAFLIKNGVTVDFESAVQMDDVERAAELLEAEVDLDVNEALVSVKGVEMARLLLEHGADPNTRVGALHEHMPLGNAVHHFADSGEKDQAEFLIENGAEPDIVVAAGLNDIDRVRTFLKRDPDLTSAPSYEGFTALHATRSAEIVHLLLDHGINPNARVIWCNGGYMVLQIKLWQHDIELIKLLLHRGADPRGKDTMRGWTATKWAEHWHRWEEAQLLLAKYEDAS